MKRLKDLKTEEIEEKRMLEQRKREEKQRKLEE